MWSSPETLKVSAFMGQARYALPGPLRSGSVSAPDGDFDDLVAANAAYAAQFDEG